MQLYDCKLRLGGAVTNEIRKYKITAAEIMFLRALHGEDAVVDVKAAGSDKRSHAEERARLKEIYFAPALTTDERNKTKMELFRNLFGHDSMDLPVKLPDMEGIAPEPEKPVRTRVAAQEANPMA